MKKSIQQLRDEVRESNTIREKLLAIVERQTDRDKDLDHLIAGYGGRIGLSSSPENVQHVVDAVDGRVPIAHPFAATGTSTSTSTPGAPPAGAPATAPATATAAGAAGAGANDLKSEKPTATKPTVSKVAATVSRREFLELRKPLEELLDDSKEYFGQKLLAQTEELKSEIEGAAQRILNRLNTGSWSRIIHRDLQVVWRENVCVIPSTCSSAISCGAYTLNI